MNVSLPEILQNGHFMDPDIIHSGEFWNHYESILEMRAKLIFIVLVHFIVNFYYICNWAI